MNSTKLILTGGFLGSGKTTAIANACKILADKGIKTAIITNDQGDYLVDSRFVKNTGIPFSEVTGGCFCCNYNQLDSQISSLILDFNPSVIFAEFVGSCTDLIATVLKPLLKYRVSDFESISFSTFVDAQLLLLHLQGKTLPFKMETNYIWEKQIEEAEILIVNKIDLLSKSNFDMLNLLMKDKFASKQILFQNSLNNDSVGNWIKLIDNSPKKQDHKSIDIDYDIYGTGEANLAWLDEEIEIISSSNSSVEFAYHFIAELSDKIVKKGLPIGHLKFYLNYNQKSEKVSYTTILESNNQNSKVFEKSGSVDLLVNARIQTSPDDLRGIISDALAQLKTKEGLTVNEKFLSYFQPGYPNPVHRLV
jgi:G3E family GTPase